MSRAATTNCNHQNARIVDSDEDDDGEFYEQYRCPCGARGRIAGNSNDDPRTWNRTGEVFRDD